MQTPILVLGKGVHSEGCAEEVCYLYGIGNDMQDDKREQYGNHRREPFHG